MTTIPSTTLAETTFRDTEHLVVMSQMGPIYLVHQPSDLQSKTPASATAGPDPEVTEADAEATGTSAASALRTRRSQSQSTWGQLVGAASALTMSALAGMALGWPW